MKKSQTFFVSFQRSDRQWTYSQHFLCPASLFYLKFKTQWWIRHQDSALLKNPPHLFSKCCVFLICFDALLNLPQHGHRHAFHHLFLLLSCSWFRNRFLKVCFKRPQYWGTCFRLFCHKLTLKRKEAQKRTSKTYCLHWRLARCLRL